jgi:hypothetical protein
MNKPRGEDWKVEMSPEAEAKIAANPKAAAALKDALAQIRQALDGVATGQYASEEEAMRPSGQRKSTRTKRRTCQPSTSPSE